jgi:hypothetical protein
LRRNITLLAFVIVAAAVAFFGDSRNADALTATKAYKIITVTVVVTPSPIVYVPVPGTARFASYHTVAAPLVVAQAAPAQGNIPVTMQTKADPNYNYLHFVPHTLTLNAPYGVTSYSCVYEVYASYPTYWTLNDWGFGTGSGGTAGFPLLNYPATSDLAWEASTIGVTSWTPFYNNGTPGQRTTQLTGGGTVQFCVDLQVTVPTTQVPGTYSAPIQYTLTVTQ